MTSALDVSKIVVFRETIMGEGGGTATRPVCRVAGIGVFANPYAGRFVEDLTELFKAGFSLGETLMARILPLLDGPAVSYGKGAIVGVGGDLEHGHALLHPMLGKAMREPIGGGQALIPSAAKIGAAGATLDIPLGHKDDAWSFDHFDTMSVSVADAPRPGELLMAIALADGGRPVPRAGKARIVD
jgi:hypothetical protein